MILLYSSTHTRYLFPREYRIEIHVIIIIKNYKLDIVAKYGFQNASHTGWSVVINFHVSRTKWIRLNESIKKYQT